MYMSYTFVYIYICHLVINACLHSLTLPECLEISSGNPELARGPDDIFRAQGQCYRVQTGVNDFITPTQF